MRSKRERILRKEVTMGISKKGRGWMVEVKEEEEEEDEEEEEEEEE